MPKARPFFSPVGVMRSAAIQGLANSGGEYQAAPMNH
jgi:hypothetical protein